MVFMSSELSKAELSLWEHQRAAGMTIGRDRLPSYTLRPDLIRPRQVLSPLFRSFCLLGFCETLSLVFCCCKTAVDHVSLHFRLPLKQALLSSTHRPPGVGRRCCSQSKHRQSVVPRRLGLLDKCVRQLSYVWRPPRPPVLRSSFLGRPLRYSNADAEPYHHLCPRLQPVWSGASTTTGFSLASPSPPSVAHRRITGSARPYTFIRSKLPPFSGTVAPSVPNGESVFATTIRTPHILPTCLVSIKTFRCMRSWARSPVNSISRAPRGFACICTSMKPVPCSHRG